METLNLTQEWDKTFPKSDKIDHCKVTFINRYGITLAADMYKPQNTTGKLSAIAVCGPFGAVKEQSSGLYAQEMAERGFLTIAFDPSFTGESGGTPRYMTSPDINTEDFSAAVDFLVTHPDVDPEKAGVIGICRSIRYTYQGHCRLNDVRHEPRRSQRLFRCLRQCRSTQRNSPQIIGTTHQGLPQWHSPARRRRA